MIKRRLLGETVKERRADKRRRYLEDICSSDFSSAVKMTATIEDSSTSTRTVGESLNRSKVWSMHDS